MTYNSMSLPQHTNLMITRCTDSVIKSCSVGDVLSSDHFVVDAILSIGQPAHTVKEKLCCKFRNINLPIFAADFKHHLEDEDLINNCDITCGELLANYEKVLSATLDHHTPLKTVKIKGGVKKPWYNDTIHAARRKMRACERKMKTSKLEIHRQVFNDKHQEVTKLIDDAKATYYRNKISSSDTKHCIIWSVPSPNQVTIPSHHICLE